MPFSISVDIEKGSLQARTAMQAETGLFPPPRSASEQRYSFYAHYCKHSFLLPVTFLVTAITWKVIF